MTRIAKVLLAAVTTITAAGAAAHACTATSTVDRARNARDTDQYKAARDVAIELIDTEGWRKDQNTVESGIGTLLTEKSMGLTVPNSGVTPDDWRSVLDLPSERGHGVDMSGASLGKAKQGKQAKSDGKAQKADETAKPGAMVRDHMRKHIREWHLSGREEDEWAADPVDPADNTTVATVDPAPKQPKARPAQVITWPAQADPTAAPALAPAAAPAPEPEPIVDHAG